MLGHSKQCGLFRGVGPAKLLPTGTPDVLSGDWRDDIACVDTSSVTVTVAISVCLRSVRVTLSSPVYPHSLTVTVTIIVAPGHWAWFLSQGRNEQERSWLGSCCTVKLGLAGRLLSLPGIQ